MSEQNQKLIDEETQVRSLLSLWDDYDEEESARIAQTASVLIETARARKHKGGTSFQSLMEHYDLSSEEGLALMCLAEALLRVPDASTANALIEDKIAQSDWDALFGQSIDWLGKFSGMGLKATQSLLGSMAGRLGMPVIRKACASAMQVMAKTFVLGTTIEDALHNAQKDTKRGYTHSYDMLGEGARSYDMARQYFESYKHAIATVANHTSEKGRLNRPGVSVKLSALHPRYETAHWEDCVPDLQNRLDHLCRLAADGDIALTVDAEEADRLDMAMAIARPIFERAEYRHWDGFGMAVQTYQKRGYAMTGQMLDLARANNRKIMIRLVKGAYWDTELKHAQVEGLSDFPVFTRKHHTDLSFLSCTRLVMEHRDLCTPMIGTHNAQTVAATLHFAGEDKSGFAFQKLQGMGDSLYGQIVADHIPCSVYAPVGTHKDLLAYLVRRLLENGANSSFVNQLYDPDTPLEALTTDPVLRVRRHQQFRHEHVAMPEAIMLPSYQASSGTDLGDQDVLKRLESHCQDFRKTRSSLVHPLINGKDHSGSEEYPVNSPADRAYRLGAVTHADPDLCNEAMRALQKAQTQWAALSADARAACLEKLAGHMHDHRFDLIALLVHEAGKTMADAVAECREAEDFCRYYAYQARRMGSGVPLPGPVGESNSLSYTAKGVFVCISPWNFPMAIFTGQIVAALVTGNAVAIKPAVQTSLIGRAVVDLMLKSGIPADVIAYLPGGAQTGQALIKHPACSGVAFTGSTKVARMIARDLADREGALIPLIAETGGQNAMIVDSTALPEQVCDDVIYSAFGAAGQRCSALRVLYLQEDVADDMIDLIGQAMRTRIVAHPEAARTDIGPVIDHQAKARLLDHKTYLMKMGRILSEMPIDPQADRQGSYVAPLMAEINDIGLLDGEVFGPFLHVIRYRAGTLDQVIEAVNQTGYGLTFGVHSRINTVQDQLATNAKVGNIYINRGMTGAVVGSQPFGGQGLSGTGPKAGGPHYLYSFTNEVTLCINEAAAGGNASLMVMSEKN